VYINKYKVFSLVYQIELIKGGIFMNEYIENEAALILSVCYGIRTEVALELVSSRGNAGKQKKIVKNELSRFFNDRYELIRRVFIDYAENALSVKKLSCKYDISERIVRKYLDFCEIYYLEYKGLIELGMLDYYDDAYLMAFLSRYGRYHKKVEKRNAENYNWYQSYLNGKITFKKLRFITHMTPKTLCEI
jgi:hypothetical protein